MLPDVAMPRVDGFEALKRLKADDPTSDVPVIMVTAKGRPEDLAMARTLGARDYINKPWAEGEVEMRVDWALSAAARAYYSPRHITINRPPSPAGDSRSS